MAGSLKTAFRKAAVAAFTAAGDVKRSVTFRSMTNSAGYDTSTGTVNSTYTDYTVSMLIFRVNANEVGQGIIQANDEWALIPQYSLTPVPKVNDIIIDGTSEWKITQIKDDGADVLWKFLIRKP